MAATTFSLIFVAILLLFICDAPISVDSQQWHKSINATRLNPCSDFYAFVCDGFHRQQKLSSECSEISNAATQKGLIQAQLQSLLNAPNWKQQQQMSSQLRSLYQKMFAFHAACMDAPRHREELGSDVVLDKLKGLSSDRRRKRAFNTEWAIRAFPIGAFFQLVPLIDTRKGRTHPHRRIIGIQPKRLIVSSTTEWSSSSTRMLFNRFGQLMRTLLEDDMRRAIRLQTDPVLFPFSKYILQEEIAPNCTQQRTSCQMSDRMRGMLDAETERRVRNLFSVEHQLANNFDTNPLFQSAPDLQSMQSYLKLFQLDDPPLLPNFNWIRFVRSLLAGTQQHRIDGDMEIHVSEPGLLHRLGRLIGRLSGQQISDYLDWHTLWAFLPQLDRRYAQPYLKVTTMKDSFGVRKCPLEHRWMQMGEKCEKFIEWYFPHLLDRIYIQHQRGQQHRAGIAPIYANVYNAFKAMLQRNIWLNFETKQRALVKLAAVKANLAYFDKIFDENHLLRLYGPYQSALHAVHETPFAEMVHRLDGLNFVRRMSSSSSSTFYDPSWGVNAYYSREDNAMTVLNGYLHPPIYSATFTAPLNYASIGSVIGHELSHAFDDWGSFYDDEGKYGDWLGPMMRRIFWERKHCFVQQYGAVKIPIGGNAFLPINGSLTVNEAIADNAGLEAAYRAWQMVKSNHHAAATPRNGFDDDQRFFIHYAYRQCAKMGRIWLQQLLRVDIHAVVPARVNLPLQNFPPFARAFQCPPGSGMNPAAKCKIW